MIYENAYEATQKAKTLTSSQVSYLSLYKTIDIAWLTLRLQFLWFTASIIDQGVLFDLKALGGNFYINMFLSSVFDVPTAFLTYFLCDRLGIRITTCGLLTLATITAVISLILNGTSVSAAHDKTTAYLIIAFRTIWGGVTIFNSVVTIEVYPTELRSYGMAVTNLSMLVGGTMAAFAIDLDSHTIRSYCVMLTFGVIAFIIVATMKEVNTMSMKDTDVVYPTPTPSPYQSVERYPVQQQYYQTDEDGDDKKKRLGPDGYSEEDKTYSPSTSSTHLLTRTNDTNTGQDNKHPHSDENGEVKSPVLATHQIKGYGAVSMSPPKSPLKSPSKAI